MKLEPSSSPSRENPTEADIAAAVRDDDNEFVILHHDDGQSFMQTSGGVVEYRVGPTKQHYRVDDLDSDRVIELFAMYNRGDESYRTAVEWDDVTKEMGRGCAGVLLALVATGSALAAGLAAWLA